MEYKGVKIPKLNGRPQLWMRGAYAGGLRIVYPNGNVEYCIEEKQKTAFFEDYACTFRFNQMDAIKASIDYDKGHKYDVFSTQTDTYAEKHGVPEFLGYL